MSLKYHQDTGTLVFEYPHAGPRNLTQAQLEDLQDALVVACDAAYDEVAGERIEKNARE